jgi:hypothetical protein
MAHGDVLSEGVQRGFRWKVIEANEKKILYITSEDDVIDMNQSNFQGRFSSDQGFYPFEDGLFEWNVAYYSRSAFLDLDLEEWIAQYVSVPEGCEVRAYRNHYKSTIHLEARTYRNGRIETVGRKTDPRKDPIPQISKHYEFFRKKCPAPTPEQENQFTISGIGQSLLDSCKGDAVGLFRAWIQKYAERLKESSAHYYYPIMPIDGALLNSEGVEQVSFYVKKGFNQVFTEITLKDGHTYSEDEKGSTLHLAIEPNDALISGAKGMPLSKLIGIPGADKAIIRTAVGKSEKTDSGKMVKGMRFRASFSLDILRIPEQREDPIEDVYRDIANLMGPNGYYKQSEHIVAWHLALLEPRNLREVLSLVRGRAHVNLKDYGGPDMTLEDKNGSIRQGYSSFVRLEPPQMPAQLKAVS